MAPTPSGLGPRCTGHVQLGVVFLWMAQSPGQDHPTPSQLPATSWGPETDTYAVSGFNGSLAPCVWEALPRSLPGALSNCCVFTGSCVKIITSMVVL